MRIRMLSRWLCALFFLVEFSFVSAAELVTYNATGMGTDQNKTGKGTSPNAACIALSKQIGHVHESASGNTLTGHCYGFKGGTRWQYGWWEKKTEICEFGLGVDGLTCNPPPVDCSTVGPGIFSKSGSVISSNGSNYVVVHGGGSVCYGQCNHKLSQSASSCYSSGDGTGFCNYIGTPDGSNCSGSDAPLGRTGDPLNPPDTPDVPPSDPNDPGCPAGYGWSGTTCAKLPPPDDGDTGGGDTGGGDTGGDTGGGGTGGGSSGGGDSGGGGDTGGGDSGGGDSGGGDSGGDTGGTGPGGGSGGGSGGDGDDGEDEEPTSSVGGESCDATLSCEGDAVQCALLRQQKALHCHMKEQDDFNEHKADITALVQGDKFQLDEGGSAIEVPSFINQGTRFLPSTCPAAESFSLRMGGGRTFEISYEPLCRAASDLSGLFVAVATVLAALYVGRSVGGQ